MGREMAMNEIMKTCGVEKKMIPYELSRERRAGNGRSAVV